MSLFLRRCVSTALAIFPALCVASPLDPSALDLSLEDLGNVRVSSASWGVVPLREAPASVTVFERQDLERLGLRHLHDILNWVPGAYSSRVATTGAENRTVLRGNPGTAGGGLLVIDGQRVNTFQTVRAWGVLRNFPMALIERIEVIRGPGTARFGGGPSDEVVHVVTRRNETVSSLQITAAGGVGGVAMATLTRGDWRADFRIARSHHEMPEYRNLFDRFGRVNTSTETSSSASAVLDVGWRTHNLQVMHHQSLVNGYYGLNGSISPDDDNWIEASWWRYSGSASPGDWSIDWSLGTLRQRFRLGAVLVPNGIAPFLSGDFRQRGLLTHDARSGALTFRRPLGAHSLTFGIEAQQGENTRADLQANYSIQPPFTYLGGFESTGLRFSAPGAADRMTAAYAEDDWRLSPTQRVVVGVRHNRYRQSGSATSPRLGWVWSPRENSSLKLLYQGAFFAPTLGQLFLQNNPVIAGNPNLEPTRVRTLELVGHHQWDNLLLRATYFQRDAKDGFVVVRGDQTTATTVNAVRQHSTGLETSLLWAPTASWRAQLTASTLFTDDYVLPATLAETPPGEFVSRRTASAQLIWQPLDRWEAMLGAHWRSREGLQPTENAPRAMLQVNWRPEGEWHLWLHIENLFDARGGDIDVAGGLGIDPSTGQTARLLPLPGREVLLGAEYRWR